MRSFSAWLPALLFVLGAGAGAQVVEFEGRDLRVRCDRTWPGGLQKGFLPVWVELENRGPRPTEVELTLAFGFGTDHRVRETVAVPAGTTLEVELFAPASGVQWGSYSLYARPSGAGRQHVAVVGDFNRHHVFRNQHALLVLTEESVSEATLATWSLALATDTGTENGREIGNTRLANCRAEQAPRHFEAYTGLDLVVVDTRAGELSERTLGPLLRWVRAGGTVVLEGPEAELVAASLESLEPWLEERFDLSAGLRSELLQGEVYRLGLGVVALGRTSSKLLLNESLRSGYRELLEKRTGTVPFQDMSARGLGSYPEIPGLEDLPYRFFVAALVLFAALVGPLNFLFVKRTGRPVLLLLTIPILAVGASLLILVYGTLYQGIDVKSASSSLLLLDQRTHRATILEQRSFFAGLSAGQGLRFEAGSTVFPDPEQRSSRGLWLDFGAQPLYSGDYLPVRREARQTILGERTLRGRLAVEGAGAELRVTNGLEWTVERLTYRDGEGAYHVLDGALAPGETRPLTAEESAPEELAELLDQTSQRVFNGSLDAILPGFVEELLPGTYLACIEGASGGDAGGLESNELDGFHALLGVVELEEVR